MSQNTAVGHNALRQQTHTVGASYFNTAVGVDALAMPSTTSHTTISNTAVGDRSLYNNRESNNTAIGRYSGYNNTTGTYNTYLGTQAGESMTTGGKNTFIGRYNGLTNLDLRTSSNNIVLSDGDGNIRCRWTSTGRMNNYANQSSDFSAVFKNTHTSGYCLGVEAATHLIFFYTTGSSNVGSINTNGSSVSYNTTSDHRLKENVVYDWDATTRLKQLKPARFNFIADADTTVDGFLAHEAQAVVPEAVQGTHNEVDDEGVAVMQGIDQSKLVPLLVKTIQELEARIAALEAGQLKVKTG